MPTDKYQKIASELLLVRSHESNTLYFHGTSMEPFLREGDEVLVEPVHWEAIRRGDIVTYRFEDKYPTRRVFRKLPDRLLLSCDGWKHRRFEAMREDVLGRATARLRNGRWLRSTDTAWKLRTYLALATAAWKSLRSRRRRLFARLKSSSVPEK